MSDAHDEREDRTSGSGGPRGTARSLGRAWRALDRALGGERLPTPFEQRVARHPVANGFGVALAVGLLLSVFEAGLSALAPALAAGLIYGSTAAAERRRQGRLKRTGLWDGA
ncbi:MULTISPECIES: hypothetical protein [Streptomyces]|uniref:DUF3040 domain-containing protein n=2 Tax=Streptomyces TaxID=1883 RepID=A0ABU4K8N6_9ACTN|nr:hypothetical protein [Streptomyces roseolus]MDX2294120.1 hypothetical protein [Streptomyces roseolus]